MGAKGSGQRKYVDVLQDYLNGDLREEDLTLEHEKYLERVKTAYGLLLEAQSKTYIYNSLHEIYGLSQGQAIQVVRDTEFLFGNLNKVNRDMERHLVIEMCKEAFRLAVDQQDTKGMTAAANALAKAAGLHLDQTETPDFEKLQPSLVLTMLPEGYEQMLLALLQQGAVNLNQLPQGFAETIPYEQADDEPGRADQKRD